MYHPIPETKYCYKYPEPSSITQESLSEVPQNCVEVEGQAGNGPKPFAFQRDNELILRLILGATLRNLPDSNVKVGERLGIIASGLFSRVSLKEPAECSGMRRKS